MREGGGELSKIPSTGMEQTEWRGHKFSEKDGQAGSGGGALKWGVGGEAGVLEPPYELCLQ